MRNFSPLKHFLFVIECHFSWNLSSPLRSLSFWSVSLSQKAFKNIHEAASYAIKAQWKIKAWCVVIDCYSNSTLMLLTKLIIASQFAFFCSATGGSFLRIRGCGDVKEKFYAIFQAQKSSATWCVKDSANFHRSFDVLSAEMPREAVK